MEEQAGLPPDSLIIALAQANPVVGDVSGNLQLAIQLWHQAEQQQADLLLLSELFLSGYPPEDLVLKPAFLEKCAHALDALVTHSAKTKTGLIIGLPGMRDGKLHNYVAVIDRGRLLCLRAKVKLPNYSEFDEKRTFQSGDRPSSVDFRGIKIGVPICEDCWSGEICQHLAEDGAKIFLVANGSPYHSEKQKERMKHMAARVSETGRALISCNQLGGQDELVFDGASFALDSSARLVMRMPQFAQGMALLKWQHRVDHLECLAQPPAPAIAPLLETSAANWLACVLGLRDYVEKNRFSGVLLGLSGGIDSAVAAAMAVDALGAEKVSCIMLPYIYTAQQSRDDAQDCAERLGVEYSAMPIEPAVSGLQTALQSHAGVNLSGTSHENLQSRSRGALLMALSNMTGKMLVTTGNKSEMSVGYATLYGDMNGGFNPIKDLYKTELYRLADWRNRGHHPLLRGPEGIIIPPDILTKPPSAELRADQRDTDSLPPYDELDDILVGLVEREESVAQITARGHGKETVRRIENLLYIAEYKRRQSPPGVKITRRPFGRDRRYPITNYFRD